jgi:hypothetical protein
MTGAVQRGADARIESIGAPAATEPSMALNRAQSFERVCEKPFRRWW